MVYTFKTYLNFIWAGIANPGQTGGIVPSQRVLIERMIEPIPETYDGSIIELGAGNGALTKRLSEKCRQARILAFEINRTLAQDIRNGLAREGIGGRVEVTTAPAESLLSEMRRNGIAKADYVISGIPLGTLPKEKAIRLIETIDRALKSNGMYIQFQHSLIDSKKIKDRFPYTRIVPVVLNFPPAVIYYARK